MAADLIGSMRVNLTKGIYYPDADARQSIRITKNEENVDDYTERVCAFVTSQSERRKAQEIFSREGLLRRFEMGDTHVSFEASSGNPEIGDFHRYRAVMEMTRNSISGDVEGLLSIKEVTMDYIRNRMPLLLYQKNYRAIGIINANTGIIKLDREDSKTYTDLEGTYEDFIEKILYTNILEEEREYFKEKTALRRILSELYRMGSYSFTFNWIGRNKKKRLINVRYLYFDKDYKLILMSTEDVTDLSERDALTGGYNRRGFVSATRIFLDVVADPMKYAMMFFNIRNFKAINDLWGRDIGDSVLRNIYGTLQNSELLPVVVGRVEADHFVCLVKKDKITPEILEQLCSKKIVKDRKTVYLSLRCGIYNISPKRVTVDGMIDRAKLAKTYIKDEYVTPYKVYDDSMRSDYINRANLPAMLETGIANEEFQVYFQPVIDTFSGKIVSAEALVRWYNPERGFISPAAFVTALEENGRITELDSYVLKHVGEFLRERADAGKSVVPVSINLSWMDFYDKIMMNDVLSEIDACKEKNAELRLEITETAYASLGEAADWFLSKVHSRGTKILMDDFGSGYSSFGILQEHKFDILKIDISFVREIEHNETTRKILKYIVAMGHELGMQIVAEGAETQVQVGFLKDCGCDFIQGYFYSRPMPKDDFERYLDTHED